MDSDDRREIYRQLYETCRNHYRLEWQLLQVGAITAIGVLAIGLENETSGFRSLLFIVSGVALSWISYAMHRQSIGYSRAYKHLQCFAAQICDPNVPTPSRALGSAAVQGRVILLLVGAVLFFYGVWKDYAFPMWSRLLLSGFWCIVFSVTVDCMWHASKGNIRHFSRVRDWLDRCVIDRMIVPLFRWLVIVATWLIFVVGILAVIRVLLRTLWK